MNYLADGRPITLTELGRMRAEGEKIVMLTAYDASFASVEERCGVDVILVGDSLGNVIQGHASTLPVTMEHMVYHTECTARGMHRAFLVADLPFGSFQESPEQALRNSARLLAAGAQMVKLEGGEVMAETVRFLVERGVPVCAHIGLTPQSVHQLGGYKVQGRTEDSVERLRREANALEDAGAAMMVLEMVTRGVGADITAATRSMATIGIGAGPETHGQVLVLHDLIGVFPGKRPRFAKDFVGGVRTVEQAVRAYVEDVKAVRFPAPEHCY
jgi:3-methyl-2-oxobutanoate hydroxymethyltransferase